MNGATQVINLAAGYLAPEFRGRRLRSFADLVELVACLFGLLREAADCSIFALRDDLEHRFETVRKAVAATHKTYSVLLRWGSNARPATLRYFELAHTASRSPWPDCGLSEALSDASRKVRWSSATTERSSLGCGPQESWARASILIAQET